jgi:hypothetical protein
MWTAAQGHGFPFPYVQVAVFRTGSLKKLAEHEIWSDDFGWMYGYAGVNARGDLGVILYALGGGRYPRAQAFLRTDPTNWDGITMHAVASSDGGATKWGHYAQVLRYGDCPDTFLGMAWVMAGGNPSNRMVWFGDKDDRCPDLTVTGVAPGLGAPFDSGEAMHAFATVRNWGSSTAAASKVGYYLSRDQVKDAGDTLLARASIGSLGNGASQLDTTDLVTPTFTGKRAGTYFLLACADDTGLFDEISDSNNCASSTGFEINPASLRRSDQIIRRVSLESGPTAGPARVRAGTSISIVDAVDVTGEGASGRRPAVLYVLSRAPGPDDDEVRLTARTVAVSHSPGSRSFASTHRIAIPRDVPPGPWFLRACVRHPENDDAVAADDCRTLAVTIDSDPGTVAPRRIARRP